MDMFLLFAGIALIIFASLSGIALIVWAMRRNVPLGSVASDLRHSA